MGSKISRRWPKPYLEDFLKDRIFAALNERIAAQVALIDDGRCEDIEQYRRMCGIIYGLRMAMADIDEVISKSETTEEGF